MTPRIGHRMETGSLIQAAATKGRRARGAAASFLSELETARSAAPNRSRANGTNLPSTAAAPAATPASHTAATTAAQAPYNPTVGDVVISPFNPLGLPISGTFAPTAAEVAADPERWRGTSFDPALSLGQTVIRTNPGDES